jgi:glycosyltransferase involved in cell wall biosynthesis
MRVLMISKACVVGAYQRKLEEIAALPSVDLTVVVPPEWRDERGVLPLERAYTDGYRLVVEPMALNANFHLHFYPRLARRFAEARPDIVHIDEEPYNLAAWQALKLARGHKAKALFFSWQNLNRRYPFPFSAMEADVLRHADWAICGNHDSQTVWRAKGYGGPISVFPQFGIDPDLFSPPRAPALPRPFTIAFAGRFVPEKGTHLLIEAAARLGEAVCLTLVGSGPQKTALKQLAAESGLKDRVTFRSWMPSVEFPKFLHSLDALVLPSISQKNWKEQFGRVLVEAMACGVPVVGSTCGEIPNVIGEAGLIVPENDASALVEALRRLEQDEALRAELARKGRERALSHFTHKRIAEETVKVYREMCTSKQVNR